MAMLVLTKTDEGRVLVNTEDIAYVETFKLETVEGEPINTGCRVVRRNLDITQRGGSIVVKESLKQIHQLYERIGFTPIALHAVDEGWIRLSEQDIIAMPDGVFIWEVGGQMLSRKWASDSVWRTPDTVEFVRWDKEKGLMYGKDVKGKTTELRRWTTSERPVGPEEF